MRRTGVAAERHGNRSEGQSGLNLQIPRVPRVCTRSPRVPAHGPKFGGDDGAVVMPRDWLREPEKFGRSRTAHWKHQPDDPVVHAEQSAAFMQHQFSCDVLAALNEDGRTARWLAEATGLNER